MATPIQIGAGINIGGGIDVGSSSHPAPVLLLSLDATSYTSGTTWPALTGSAATLVNTPTYTAASPTYFSFATASSEYATATNLGALSTWTVECWFRATGSLTSQITALVGDEIDTSNINFTLAFNPIGENTGVLKAGLYNPSGWQLTAGFVPTLNTWYQVVGTYDGATIKQYSNGALQSSAGYIGAVSTDGLDYRIAARWDEMTSAIDYFPGDIAIVKIYSGDIGSTGVTTSWAANRARFGL